MAHAKQAIVRRKLAEWKCDYWATHKKLPGKWKTQRQHAVIKRELTDDMSKVPAQYEQWVQSMHKAVVTKLEEHIGHIVETGKVPIGVELSSAPSSNFPVECVKSSCGIYQATLSLQRAQTRFLAHYELQTLILSRCCVGMFFKKAGVTKSAARSCGWRPNLPFAGCVRHPS